jgi:hypothetical protein
MQAAWETSVPEAVSEAVAKSAQACWPAGIETDPPFDKMVRLVTKAVGVALSVEGTVLKGDGVLATELVLGGPVEEAARHGRYPGTADLVTIDGDGLCVTDYKTKWKMDVIYADRELRQTVRSWQLLQYAYFVQQQYDRPVVKLRKLLVAFTPALKVWTYTHQLTQQELSNWCAQAETVWRLMDRQLKPLTLYDNVWKNSDSCERYGWDFRCGFYDVCWNGDTIAYAR